MPEPEFTPGPWSKMRDHQTGHFEIRAQPHPSLRGFTKTIAHVVDEAHANLAVASPDLYHALDNLLTWGTSDAGAVAYAQHVLGRARGEKA